MPNVVVYVKQRHADSFADEHEMKVWVREAVERALSERGTTEASDGSEPGTPGHGSAERLSRPSTPRSESDREVKPDPKPGRR